MSPDTEKQIEPHTSPSALVIGAGIAGLTAGWRLMQSGWHVRILESGIRPGGAMVTEREGEYLIEHGPNTALESDPRIGELIHELGLADEKRIPELASKKRFILKQGRPQPLPMSPQAFFGSGFFSWKAKLSLLGEPFRKPGIEDHEESLSEFVLRRLGREFLDYAINPFVAGVYAGAPDRLGVEQAFPKLHALEKNYGSLIRGQVLGARQRKREGRVSKQRAPMFSFRQGLGSLPERFQELLGDSLVLQTRAKKLSLEEGLWAIETECQGQPKNFEADRVIYAGTAHQLPEISIEGVSSSELQSFGNIYHPPVSSLSLAFPRNRVEHPLDGFGLLVPEVEKRKILGALFMSTLFPERCPKDQVLFTVFIGGTRQPHYASLSREELLPMVLEELKPMLGISSEPTHVFHRFWEKAIPQYEVGYGSVRNRLDDLETSHPGLHFCGNYRGGISVADTILHALKLTDLLLDHKD